MKLRAGTSGYSYAAWKGNFYPERLPAASMLAYYAERLPAVEINNTFYRLPKRSVLEAWRDSVPEAFRFSIKASRRITHLKRLRDVAGETGYLLEAVGALGKCLGALLFQLPPNLRLDLDRLAAFLEILPARTPATFEFRHPSWADPRVHELLRSRGCALCVADTEEQPATELTRTAAWGYLRLRRPSYTESELAAWGVRLAASGWKEAYVFFKHEEEGVGPRLAARFLELAGGAVY